MPEHGDTDKCLNCHETVRYWDGNPNHLGAHWFHPGPTFEDDGFGFRECNPARAEVSP
jgi:hypothetical protein